MQINVVGLVKNVAGEVLLIRHALRGTWELPGGKLHVGEPWQEGVLREVLEEAGVEAEMSDQRPIAVLSVADGTSIVIVGQGFAGGDPYPGSDAAEARWWALDSLPEDLTDCPSRAVLP